MRFIANICANITHVSSRTVGSKEVIIKVEFVVRKDTPYRRREFARRKKISIDGQDVYVVAPEDLILSKLAWAKDSKSEVQLKDVQNLLQSVKKLDRRYLARWTKQLGVESLYREANR